ncbi:exocyst complex component 7 [Patella vulgata]|uniref:exocyst complex component 7 n=1 Tax=Patella vulgata TaxID=6465 RepID=UPI00218020D4|nr:exocyst complex component 7 [Patella vulgata]
MEDIAQRRRDIDKKLEKEMHNMTLLKDSLKKSSTNTNNMLSILTSFENRLKHLESTIVPVYNETENLRRRQENIEKTLHTVDNVLGYYHVARDVEAYIKEGPNAAGLNAYLSYMEKLLKAMEYFETNDKSGKQMDEISRLFEDGNDALQHEFRSLLTRHGTPVPPIVIMDLLGMDEELPPVGTDTDLALQHLPEKIILELSAISGWLVANGGNNTEFHRSYVNSRSSILSKSIQGLKEHLRSASGNSTSLSFGVQSSPNVSGKVKPMNNTPIRKSRKKLSFLSKKATTALMSPFEPGHRRQGSSSESIKEEFTDIETELYITELSALLRLMQSEAHLMNGIIQEKNHRMVFDNIVQPSLDTVVNEGELLANSARRNIGRHEFTTVLSIFPIVKHLRTIKPEFDLILEGCQAPTRAKLASLLSTLDSTGAKALEEFTDSIRIDPDKASNMPRDGTVHELANHTIIFLEQLKEYGETAGAMLLMHGEQASPAANITPDTCKLKVADYMTRVLSALGLNLSNKAETYGDPALKPIFMLNNFNYILKSIKRSGLLKLLLMWNDKVEGFYLEQIQVQKRFYSQSWSKVLHYLLEVDKPISIQRAQDPAAKLKDKDRQNIKDKFTGFNKELDEIYKIQKGYAIPDPELRHALKEENKQYICPRYKMFLDKYTNLNFTKNPEKYMKYTVDDVANLIDKYFDASA